MYIPTSFRVDDLNLLDKFIDEYSFAAMISIRDEGPFATHLPLLIDRERRVLRGHFARANPHCDVVGSRAESLAIFSGPHAYISPSWYETELSVPTWNYTAVHVTGPLLPIDDAKTSELVDATVAKYESTRPEPWAYILPSDFRENMLKGIVGFEMAMNQIEGKFKLGQNRPEADQTKMLANLKSACANARSLAEFIERQRALE